MLSSFTGFARAALAALALLSAPAAATGATLGEATGLDPETIAQIEAEYRDCIAAELQASDWDGNGVVEATADASDFDEVDYFADGQAHCLGRLEASLELALADERLAALEGRQRAAQARVDAAEAAIAARTQAIIAGARRQMGPN